MSPTDKIVELIERNDHISFKEVYDMTKRFVSPAFKEEFLNKSGRSISSWKKYTAGIAEPNPKNRVIYLLLVKKYMPMPVKSKEVNHV